MPTRPPVIAFCLQAVSAVGYLSILIAPAMLGLAAVLNLPYIAFGVVMLVYPLLRSVFGAVPDSPRSQLHERIELILSWLGIMYCFALVASLVLMLLRLRAASAGTLESIGWMSSLWVTLIFGTCVAHDLLHLRTQPERLLGHLLAGVTGYPLLGHEHSRHHNLPGNTDAAEWPRIDENVWRFSWRRMNAIFPETLGSKGLLIAGNPKSAAVRGVRAATAATCVTLFLFGVAAGWTGAAVYVITALLVTIAIQIITYLQHWGLGDDTLADARTAAYSWESDCRFQAWVTLNLSLHQAHHDEGSMPYYRIGLSSSSPRLPTGYLLLMFVAFIPPLWRRVMTPALAYWKAHPKAPRSAGRKLTCIGFYDGVVSINRKAAARNETESRPDSSKSR